MSLSAAVVGARRVRQGTGEFVARELQRRGVRVEAIVGTTPVTLADAREELAARHGIRARGYLSLPELLAAERVDLVAICTPMEAHREAVLAALAAGCHVLCEKPLLWDPGAEEDDAAEDALGAAARELGEAARAAGKLLALNTQWPATLRAFEELHPGALQEPLERFEMHLGPTRTGAAAVLDSGSHPLSMLHALVGPGELRAVEVRYEGEGLERLRCSFDYEHRRGRVAVCMRLSRCPAPPRPAGYALNGRAVEREVELPGYRILFRSGARRAEVGDPLALLVEDYLARVARGEETQVEELVAGATQLHRLARAARSAEHALACEERS
ncbi:MAG: Gfo/Idh/MocA family protein [Planctomycetota bacterium]